MNGKKWDSVPCFFLKFFRLPLDHQPIKWQNSLWPKIQKQIMLDAHGYYSKVPEPGWLTDMLSDSSEGHSSRSRCWKAMFLHQPQEQDLPLPLPAYGAPGILWLWLQNSNLCLSSRGFLPSVSLCPFSESYKDTRHIGLRACPTQVWHFLN